MKNGMIGQHVRERLHTEMMAMLDKFRKIEGEAMMNSLLRNLLKQSDTQLADLGFPAEDETADLQVQLRKARTEAEISRAYTNHFGATLQKIQKRTDVSDALGTMVDMALKWQPGAAETDAAPPAE